MPHLPQKPRSLDKAFSHLAQNRFDSGTFGSAITCFSGSVEGSGGSEISPAPSCERDDRELLRLDDRLEPDLETGDEPVFALIPDVCVPVGVAAAVRTLVKLDGPAAVRAVGRAGSAIPHTLQ